MQSLKLISRNEIDDIRWNLTVSNANQSRIYAQTWYLDAVTGGNWYAFIVNDYQFVMPLAYRRKLGIPYIFQPFISQQLGVFGKEQCPPDLLTLLLKSIPQKFWFVDITIVNKPKINARCYSILERQNHIIDLNKSYQSIAKDYNRNTRRNIKRAMDQSLTFQVDIKVEQFIDFQSYWEPGEFTAPNRTFVEKLISAANNYAHVIICGVFDQEELIATGLFIVDNQRVWFLLCASSKVGKEKMAMFFLVDTILKMYAEKPLIFDFTGSNIPSIIQRNSGFGANTEHYYYLSRKSIFNLIRL